LLSIQPSSKTTVLGRSSSATSTVNLAFNGTPSSPSATLIVPQGLGQIADTLTKGEAVRVDTHIGAGQTLLR
jgi:hypothetical protein